MPLYFVSAHAQIKAYTLVRADTTERALAIASERKVDHGPLPDELDGRAPSSLESWVLVERDVTSEKLDGIAVEAVA